MTQSGYTKMWRIKEAPQYEIEQTPGAWILWGPCKNSQCEDEGEDCAFCGGTYSMVIEVCGLDEDGNPLDVDMITRCTRLESWTPQKMNLPHDLAPDLSNRNIEDALNKLQDEWRDE